MGFEVADWVQDLLFRPMNWIAALPGMIDLKAAEPIDEQQRLEALLDLELLDTPEEIEYSELAQLASEICGTPISLVSLLDKERQWFKAAVGTEIKETHRDVAFCAHAIHGAELFVIENATEDERFSDNPLVTGPLHARFYAGVPLEAPSGHAVGTLCVIDTIPRTLSESQTNALKILARQVKTRMELRHKQRMLERAGKAHEKLLAELCDKNNLFSAFMNNGPFISYIKDQAGRYVYLNDRHRDHFRLKPDGWMGLTDHQIFESEIADSLRAADLKVLRGGVPVELSEVTLEERDKAIHWRSYKFPLRQENGDLMLAGMSINVTEEICRQEKLEHLLAEKFKLAESLENSRLLMQTFIDNNPNICFFKSEQGRYLSYNSKFAELFGISMTDWVGKSDHDIRPKEVADRFRAGDLIILESGEVSEDIVQFKDTTGSIVWKKSFKFALTNLDGSRIIAGVSIDITREIEKELALSEANSQLERLATTDLLTGLSNRRVFEERIEREFGSALRKKRPLALIVMDIDDFKKRNDTYGHAAGDEALRTVGKILLKSVRIGDLAARIGGEEFAILLPDTDTSGAALLAERIRKLLCQADCGGLKLTASAGIAAVEQSHPQTTVSWKRLISCADAAMYDAKNSGKNRFVIHELYGLSMHDLIGS